MIYTRTHPIRRAVSIAAFVVALILLTGTPGKVREITRDEDTPNREVELKAAHPSADAIG